MHKSVLSEEWYADICGHCEATVFCKHDDREFNEIIADMDNCDDEYNPSHELVTQRAILMSYAPELLRLLNDAVTVIKLNHYEHAKHVCDGFNKIYKEILAVQYEK